MYLSRVCPSRMRLSRVQLSRMNCWNSCSKWKCWKCRWRQNSYEELTESAPNVQDEITKSQDHEYFPLKTINTNQYGGAV